MKTNEHPASSNGRVSLDEAYASLLSISQAIAGLKRLSLEKSRELVKAGHTPFEVGNAHARFLHAIHVQREPAEMLLVKFATVARDATYTPHDALASITRAYGPDAVAAFFPDAARMFRTEQTSGIIPALSRPIPAKVPIPTEGTLAHNGHLSNAVRTLAPLPLLSEIEIEQVDFLWEGRIVLGKLNISDGDPGLGKTMWALDIAARVTNGDTMPDGSPGIGPAGVVYFTAEDGPADTLRPRLEAADGDPRLVIPVTTIKLTDETGKETERLPTFRDTAVIKELITRIDAKLVVFDPMMAYLHADTNAYIDQNVRAELAPLALLAQETGAAILLIRHLNKSSGGNALYRGGGSIGIIGAARSGLLVAKHPDDETRRVLSSEKFNLGPPPPSMEYAISANSDGVPFITWHGESQYSALQLVSAVNDEFSGVVHSGVNDAVDFLREALKYEERPSKELETEARSLGITTKNLRDARKKLGIKPHREGGFGSEGQWMYPMPTKMPTDA